VIKSFHRVLCSLAVLVSAVSAAPSFAGQVVAFSSQQRPGTIVVKTTQRRLYLVTGPNQAIKYTVGVGRAGKQWFGTTSIVSKHIRPAWMPPADIRGGKEAYVIPSGASNNPMGEAALVLADHDLAIHGTNNPGSIGGYVSWGCIRMYNADILDLFSRVNVGTLVAIVN
jgi:lipoprotein-anchoring transpeptidase ErfK/SrfK